LFDRGELTLVTSWITFAEVLIKPLQHGDAVTEAGYRGFFTPSTYFEIVPVDQGISEQAAALRALHGFKLPDAIHIATGMAAGCTHFLTGDAKWTQTGLKVTEAANL
jgi:predicted nucleic acid-binding protein